MEYLMVRYSLFFCYKKQKQFIGERIQSNELYRILRTGYLTGNYKTAFNAGKIQEVEQRIRHVGMKEG